LTADHLVLRWRDHGVFLGPLLPCARRPTHRRSIDQMPPMVLTDPVSYSRL